MFIEFENSALIPMQNIHTIFLCDACGKCFVVQARKSIIMYIGYGNSDVINMNTRPNSDRQETTLTRQNMISSSEDGYMYADHSQPQYLLFIVF